MGGFKKICRDSQISVTIGQKRWTLYTKTQVCFIVTGDIDSTIKHRTTLSICMLLTVTSSSIYTECIVGFPLQQRLHETATMLHYTYIVLLKQTCVITTEARVPFVIRPYEILWWAKWHWGRQLSEYFCSSLAVPFRHCYLPVFIYTLLLPEGQADDSWEPSSTAVLYRQSCPLDRKVPS